MNVEMQMARMLAESIDGFIKIIYKHYENKSNPFILNRDTLYQLKLFVEEFKFQIIADELHRINQTVWNKEYTYLLINRFRLGLNVINEYVGNNYDDLFIFTARLYTLNSLNAAFAKLNSS